MAERPPLGPEVHFCVYCKHSFTGDLPAGWAALQIGLSCFPLCPDECVVEVPGLRYAAERGEYRRPVAADSWAERAAALLQEAAPAPRVTDDQRWLRERRALLAERETGRDGK